MSTYNVSLEHHEFLKQIKRRKRWILFTQIFIIVFFILLWEVLARMDVINTFLTSSPSNVLKTTINLAKTNQLFRHIGVTVYETLLSFGIASIFGFFISIVLWWNPFVAKVSDPYLTIINSLPKVALGPLIIIWVGASINSIIFMALLISLIISIINIYNGFLSTDEHFITLLKSFKASKKQIFWKVILPSNKLTIINSLKINISMSLIGVIMGELLVSKEGLGYLIMYGSQVFNINLVITAVFLLGIVSYLMYYVLYLVEKRLMR